MASYLSDTTLAVKIEDAISRRQLNCGVPQASVLGPLLFTDIKRWMTSHQLLLNKTKTETVFYARNSRVPPAITTGDVCGCYIAHQPTVRDIGIFLGSGMDMSMQVARTCRAAYFQLHNIAKIRHCLTIDACKTIVHGLVTSKLDYINAVLCGINGRLLQKLQRVQNSAARVITQQ